MDSDVAPGSFDIQMLVIDAASTMENTDVLQACALTCQAWLSRARRHLYSHIILMRRRQFTLLARTLTDSPWLGSLVHNLRLILTNTGVAPGQWDHISFTPHAISQLKSLRSVTFGCYFKPIPASFYPFMRTFATCPTLKVVYFLPMQFSTFEDIVRVVLSFPCVESLCIAGCSWDKMGNPVDASEYPGHGRSLQELKLLDVRDGAPLLQLFAHCAITKIMWWPSNVRWIRHHYAVLSEYYTMLEDVELHCPNGNLEWVADVLPYIQSKHFRRLAIVYPCHEQTREKTMQLWSDARLDDLLSGPPFLHMQQLRLCFLCSTAEAAETQWWQKEIERIFPDCHQRRLIKLEVVDRNDIE
ncbi:hypothetical protein L226DRAFT_613791 [Lentinus tigrinus ALCF2SS1-7]|uniref:F-box domain-containing protein n=1 Tax=Lentinus tigrinus ALCF2SS1-6 TaxID=1328759 RepID=A0A5C2RYG8_9APHY|nr:hypothetical protein L227DRAFT_656407 [Lentinus tigrinus ALCF2SS1-6]RPD74027.1 hypothetical protein L226DRAFT_613791 [Lentinus tigrinus ALCF2SS1-7]